MTFTLADGEGQSRGWAVGEVPIRRLVPVLQLTMAWVGGDGFAHAGLPDTSATLGCEARFVGRMSRPSPWHRIGRRWRWCHLPSSRTMRNTPGGIPLKSMRLRRCRHCDDAGIETSQPWPIGEGDGVDAALGVERSRCHQANEVPRPAPRATGHLVVETLAPTRTRLSRGS